MLPRLVTNSGLKQSALPSCGDLNENGPLRFIYLNAQALVGGTVGKDEEVWPVSLRVGYEFQKPTQFSVVFLLPVCE